MKTEVWKKVKVALLPRICFSLFLYLGFYLWMLPRAIERGSVYAPWILLASCGLMGLAFELIFHPVFNWYMVRFGFRKQKGFLPSFGDNEKLLVVGLSISPRATLFLTNERLVIRVPGPILKRLRTANWKETKSIPVDSIVKVDTSGIFGKIVLNLSNGMQQPLRVSQRRIWVETLGKMMTEQRAY